MTAPTLRPTGHAAAENELLAQLGLPPSAAPEDVDQIHEAVSEYLAAAPAGIRGWAHAQAAALDAAYLQLTDPVGFGGSALRSPTRPPRVAPGGPATPPARRDPIPPAPQATGVDALADADADEGDGQDVEPADDEDVLEALYASVTPSAHRDMRPDDRPKPRPARSRRVSTASPVAAAPSGGRMRRVALAGAAAAVMLGVAFGAYSLGGGGTAAGTNGDTAQASASAPAIDEAKVAGLMEQLATNPNDTTTLLALADEYYAASQWSVAGQWLDRVLAIDPKNIQGLLARGAVSFNTGDTAAAEQAWKQVVDLDPNNVEAHYDLGFLYLYAVNPDVAAVEREWNKVIELDPTSAAAQNAKAHLDSLAAKSMLPSISPAASPAVSPAASPVASPVASPAASPVASPATSPVASPAASPQP